MAIKPDTAVDLSTEQKIKEAARKVFTQKGYAATRTRDIAEEAGINLALLNYYFRSKEKLFEEIMLERIQQLFGTLVPILIDESTSLETKIDRLVSHYIDMLLEHPDLPIFVLSELREHPDRIQRKIPIATFLEQTNFFLQIRERKPDINPIHFMLNILGMTVFPFAAKPIFGSMESVQKTGFNNMMEERRKLIPSWVRAMLAVD